MVKPSEEEEKYFQQQEIDRRKEAQLAKEIEALNKQEATKVADVLGIDDQDLALELVGLGFSSETAGVFPLLPLVYVAWADGNVTSAERNQILDLARDRGAKKGSAGFAFLSDLLEKPLKPSFFDTCIKTIRKIFESMDPAKTEHAKQDLVSLSLSVAEASGGFLGLFGNKVSDDERKIIEDIVRDLKLQDSAAASSFMDALGK